MTVLERFMTCVRKTRKRGWVVLGLYQDQKKKIRMKIEEPADVTWTDEIKKGGFLNRRTDLDPKIKKAVREKFKKTHPVKFQLWARN